MNDPTYAIGLNNDDDDCHVDPREATREFEKRLKEAQNAVL